MQPRYFNFSVQVSHYSSDDCDPDIDMDDQETTDTERTCRQMTDISNDIPTEVIDAIYCDVHLSELFAAYNKGTRDVDSVLLQAEAVKRLADLMAKDGFDIRDDMDGDGDDDDDYRDELMRPRPCTSRMMITGGIVFTSHDRAVEIRFIRDGCQLRFSQSCDWSRTKTGVDLLIRAMRSFEPAVEITGANLRYSVHGVAVDMSELLEDEVSVAQLQDADEQTNIVIDAVCNLDGYRLEYQCMMDADPWIGKLIDINKLLEATFAVEHHLDRDETERATTSIFEVLDTEKRYANMMFWNLIKYKGLERRVR